MRRVLLLLWFANGLQAAISCSITSPTASSTISGQAYSVSLSVSGDSDGIVSYAAWTFDDELPKYVSLSAGVTFPYAFNTWTLGNTAHVVSAKVFDAAYSLVQDCGSISFSIHNAIPSDNDLTVTTSIDPSLTWSGVVTVQPSSGMSSPHYAVMVDGISAGSVNSQADNILMVNTQDFSNGPHHVKVQAWDNSLGAGCSRGSYTCPQSEIIATWGRLVTFSNGAGKPAYAGLTPQQAYLSPAGTLQLTASVTNSDGTPATVAAVTYVSSDSTATVSGTGLVTGVAFGTPTISAYITNPARATITLTQAQTASSLVTAINWTDCTTKLPTAGKWYMLVDSEWEQVATAKCDGGVGGITINQRGALGTTAASHASNATGTIAFVASTQLWVDSANAIKAVCPDNSVITNYQACAKWFASQFADYTQYDDPVLGATNLTALKLRAGYTATEPSMANGISIPPTNTNEATFASSQAAYVANIAAYGNIYAHPVTTCLSPYWSVTYPAANWTIPLMTRVAQSWIGHAWGMTGCDETTGPYGNTPYPQSAMGANVTQIAGDGITCTVTWPGWYLPYSGHFLITGASAGHSVLNTAPPYTSVYTATSVDANTFTFPCGMNGTADSTSDPGLVIQPWTAWSANSSYAPYDVFATLRAQLNAAGAGTPAFTEPPAAYGSAVVGNWQGNKATSGHYTQDLSDFAESYVANIQPPGYTPVRMNLANVIPDFAGQHVYRFGRLGVNKPWVAEAGVTNSYVPVNRASTVNVANCSGDVFTFASDHGVRNVIAAVTRFRVSGNSEPLCNGNFFVRSAPDSTHLQVYRQATTMTGGSGTGGTATFTNGHSYTLATFSWQSSGSWGSGNGKMTTTGSSPVAADQGVEFAITGGTYPSTVTSARWLLLPSPASSLVFYKTTAQIPDAGTSGTGGTAAITKDLGYVAGVNQLTFYPILKDRDFATSYALMPFHLGAFGIRGYTGGFGRYQLAYMSGNYYAAGTVYNPPFDPTGADTIQEASQVGLHPLYEDGSGTAALWGANGYANLMAQRLIQYALEPRCPSQFWAPYTLAICRSANPGASSSLIGTLNYSMVAQSVTANLSPYLISGQGILRYLVSGHGIGPTTVIAAGTASDTVTLQPGQAVYYVFDPSQSSAYAGGMTFHVPLNGATDAVVLWDYQPDTFTKPMVAAEVQPNVTVLAGGIGRVPADRNIGPIFYQIVRRDANGHPLNSYTQSDMGTTK